MSTGTRHILLAVAVLVSLTAIVALLAIPLLRPPARDIWALVGFLLLSGGITVVLGISIMLLRPPHWISSLRARLILMSVLTALLALANVAFTSVLMFLSSHDLGLLALLLGFSTGMAVLLALVFAQPTVQSIRALLDAVRCMGSGDLTARVPVESRDEVAQLATAFNSMASQLEEVSAREHRMEQGRRSLVTAVSHDLRTPLASIRAMMESISDGVVSDRETISRFVDTTLAEVRGLTGLVNDLFELSQIDAGVLELRLEMASLDDLVSDTLASMSVQAKRCGVKLTGSAEDGLQPVLMDSERIQRVLNNLVQNAIQNTSADGTVELRAEDVGHEIRVVVADTGRGIAEKDRERVFEWAYRPDDYHARSNPGTGLGLSIAKGIVEAHEGRIWLVSAEGEGTTFFFSLPKPGG
jgi:signal transduction histidine kinase